MVECSYNNSANIQSGFQLTYIYPFLEVNDGEQPDTSGVPPSISGVPPSISGVPPSISGVPPSISGVPPSISGVPITPEHIQPFKKA